MGDSDPVGGFASVAAAEHWIQVHRPAVAGTVFAQGEVHVVRSPVPGARAVRFPGVDQLVGTLPVSAALAYVRVALLGGGAIDPGSMLLTRDFVRPIWNDERRPVLTVMPAGDGIVVPFETRNPTPCCASH